MVPKVVPNEVLRNGTDSPEINHFGSLLSKILVNDYILDNFDHSWAGKSKQKVSPFDHFIFIFQYSTSLYNTHICLSILNGCGHFILYINMIYPHSPQYEYEETLAVYNAD